MTKFSIKEMNANFGRMQREVMLIKALSVYSVTPPASAFKLVQSLVASITHYSDVLLSFKRHG